MSLFEPIEKEKKFSTVNVSRIICLTEANTETDEEKLFLFAVERERESERKILSRFSLTINSIALNAIPEVRRGIQGIVIT